MERTKNKIPTCLIAEITGLSPELIRKVRNLQQRRDHHGIKEAEAELCKTVEHLKERLHRENK